MKITAIALTATLALTGSAFAAAHESDSGSSSAGPSAHQLASNFTGALHRIGAATRNALHRADASLHRMGKHDSDRGNG